MSDAASTTQVLIYVSDDSLVELEVIRELYLVELASSPEDLRTRLEKNPQVFALVLDSETLKPFAKSDAEREAPFAALRGIARPDLHLVGVAATREMTVTLKERGCDKSCLGSELLATLRAIQRRRTTGRLSKGRF